MMIEIVVYLTEDYKKHASIWVNNELTKAQIRKAVNEQFDEWWYYDILTF